MADNTPSAAELMADTLGGDGENCQDNLGKCNNSLNKVTNQLHTCKKSISDINFLKKKYEEVAWKALRSMPYFNLDQRYYTVDGATYVVYVGVSLSTYGRPVHAPDLQTYVRVLGSEIRNPVVGLRIFGRTQNSVTHGLLLHQGLASIWIELPPFVHGNMVHILV